MTFDSTVTLGNLLTIASFIVGMIAGTIKFTKILDNFDRRLERLEDWHQVNWPKLEALISDKIARDAIDRARREEELGG